MKFTTLKLTTVAFLLGMVSLNANADSSQCASVEDVKKAFLYESGHGDYVHPATYSFSIAGKKYTRTFSANEVNVIATSQNPCAFTATFGGHLVGPCNGDIEEIKQIVYSRFHAIDLVVDGVAHQRSLSDVTPTPPVKAPANGQCTYTLTSTVKLVKKQLLAK